MSNSLYDNMTLLSQYSEDIKSALTDKESPASGGFSTFAEAISNISTTGGDVMTGEITCTTMGTNYTITSAHGLSKAPKYMILYSYKSSTHGSFCFVDCENSYQWTAGENTSSNVSCFARYAFGSSSINEKCINIISAGDTVKFYVGSNMSSYINTGTNGVKFIAIG